VDCGALVADCGVSVTCVKPLSLRISALNF
jgi:hypothetical protein